MQLLIGNPDDYEPVADNPFENQSEKEWLGIVAELLRDDYHAGDIEGVQKKLDHFKSRAADISPDPELGKIETAACHGLLRMAEFCCDQISFAECLSICESVRDVLEIKKERYIRNGKTPKPDSMTCLALITHLAECKW